MSITFNGCSGVTASIPNNTATCSNCYNFSPNNGGQQMFVRFDLKRRSSSGSSFTTIQSEWVTDFDAYFFIGSSINNNDYIVEAFTSFQEDGCSFPFNTNPQSCLGEWQSFAESTEFEVGFPNFLVDVIDNQDGNNNGIFCADDIAPGTDGVSFQTFTSTSERGYMIIICQKDAVGGCSNQKGTGWLLGKLPSTFNLLYDLWRTPPNNSWRFWPGEYEVTVAVKSLPCTGWEERTFTFFVVDNNNC